uniref:KAP NTPase domain-containing protein n=1 Tax=Heterorhabditis bacteriophora TaxID=37862 RepID=A0A1I7XT89_HETBA
MEALNALIDGNKFLTMPRLSSPNYLDELCPVSSRNQRRLCAILPIMDTTSDAQYIDNYRMYAKESKKRWNDLKSSARDILVIWRLDHMKARFTWLLEAWNGDGAHLDLLLEGIVRQTTRLDETTHTTIMIDEFSPSWWTRACRAAVRMFEAAWFHLTKEEAYPVLSAIATFLLIIIVGYGLNYMNQEGRPRKPRVFSTDEWHPEDPKANCDPPKLNRQARLQRIMSVMSPHIHELRAESYFGMIRLLKPGCRSLILLTDEPNKDRLLKEYAQYIYPLRKLVDISQLKLLFRIFIRELISYCSYSYYLSNKTFSFGYLLVNKNLPWFRKLLEHTLPLREDSMQKDGSSSLYEKLKTINPRQTIGTVLVLCGWKLYFSIYHPMHTAGKRKHFLGFDDDMSANSDDSGAEVNKEDEIMLRSNIVNVENVLKGFPIWLDRLLEGSIRRYYIPEWPDNLR